MVEKLDIDKEFEAISHPLRIKILEILSKKPLRFSELKRELGIESSGKLDFHISKLGGLVEVNSEGKYALTREGYAALQAIEAIRRYGWQRRAYYLNLLAYLVANAYAAISNLNLWLTLILPITSAWIAFYSYWAIVKRGIFRAF